jgi:hypothetical protein
MRFFYGCAVAMTAAVPVADIGRRSRRLLHGPRRFGRACLGRNADRLDRWPGRHDGRLSTSIAGCLIRSGARQFAGQRYALFIAGFANQFAEPTVQRQSFTLRRIFGFLTHVPRKPVELPIAQATSLPAGTKRL